MTVGMDSSNGGGKFPDYESQLKFFEVIYFGESGQYIVDKWRLFVGKLIVS